MPSKQELETTNDELLTENDHLRRASSQQAQQLETLAESLQRVTARLEALASRPPQSAPNSQTASNKTASSRDELAAQIEPLVTGLKAMIERQKMETVDQYKRLQVLQTMLDRNERTNGEFTNSIRRADIQTDRLSKYIDKWQGQPRMTMWKVTGAMFVSTILAGLLIAFLVSWKLSPTRQLIEDASKWRALTQAMTPEQVKQIESRLNRREQTTDANTPPATSVEPTPAPKAITSPTSPPMQTNRRNRR